MSSDVQFTPQNQVKIKKGQRVLRCPVSTVSLTADIYQLIFERGGGRDSSGLLPLDTPQYSVVFVEQSNIFRLNFCEAKWLRLCTADIIIQKMILLKFAISCSFVFIVIFLEFKAHFLLLQFFRFLLFFLLHSYIRSFHNLYTQHS